MYGQFTPTPTTTVRELLYWSYPNLAMASVAVVDGTPSYGRKHYAVRTKYHKAFLTGRKEFGHKVSAVGDRDHVVGLRVEDHGAGLDGRNLRPTASRPGTGARASATRARPSGGITLALACELSGLRDSLGCQSRLRPSPTPATSSSATTAARASAARARAALTNLASFSQPTNRLPPPASTVADRRAPRARQRSQTRAPGRLSARIRPPPRPPAAARRASACPGPSAR